MQIERKFAISLIPLLLAALACSLFSEASVSSATPGSILFKDSFSDSSSGWDRINEENGITDYIEGAYRIYVNSPSYYIWANPGLNFTDTIIEVEATKVAGPDDNDFGIICRYQDPDHFYYFIISSDGYYGISKVLNGDQEFIEMETFKYSEAIKKGQATNKLQALCIGNHLVLYVNDLKLAEVRDSALISGDVGLIAGSFNVAGTDIYFDNFVVRNP